MQLPFPAAALLRRARNAKSAKERHDAAYYAWEASIRLAAAPSAGKLAAALAAPSTGDWARAVDTADRVLSADPIRDAAAFLASAIAGTPSSPRSVTPRQLLDAVPAYRNKVLGHGSLRSPDFYEAGAAVLLPALEAAWSDEVFAPPGARLVYVESVALDDAGTRRARIFDLTGFAPTLADEAAPVPERILPGRLYLRGEAGFVSLHPWVLYQDSDARERVLFFNGRRKSAQYLDYVSGECLQAKPLAAAFPSVNDELAALLQAEAAPAAEVIAPSPGGFADYRILGKLGEGGMGVVYLARQLTLDRAVALKVLPAASDAVAVARFRREIGLLSRCEHPNVVKILSSGEHEGMPFYAMELIEGADLAEVGRAFASSGDFDLAVSSASERVRRARAELFANLPEVPRSAPAQLTGEGREQRLARVFRDAAAAVHYLHGLGILHRDLKPANLMVTAFDQRIVVMDLGLAAAKDASRSLTRDKTSILGSLRYMPPEQLQRNLIELDARADVYALGATFYELLCGRPVFDGDSEPRLIEQVLREDPLPARKANPLLPRDLATILDKTLARDREARYRDADALARDLDSFLAARPIAARPPTLWYVLGLTLRRNKLLAAVVAASVALLAGLLTLHVRQLGAERDAARRNFLAATAQRAIAYDEHGDSMEAELLSAYVLSEREDPEMRGLAVKLTNRLHLRTRWERAVEAGRCGNLAQGRGGTLLCARKGGVDGFELATGRLVGTWADGEDVRALAVNAAGRGVRGDGDGSVRVFDAGSPDAAQVLVPRGPSAVAGVAIDEAGAFVAVGFESGRVLVLPLAGGTVAAPPADHPRPVRALRFAPSGAGLAIGSDDNTLTLWRAADGAVRTSTEHENSVVAVSFADDGNTLLSASDDGSARAWRTDFAALTLTPAQRYGPHRRSVHDALALPGDLLATISRDAALRIWDQASGREVARVAAQMTPLRALLVAEGGRALVVATDERDTGQPGTVRVWDLGAPPRTLPEQRGAEVTSVAYAADGRWLATGAFEAPEAPGRPRRGRVTAWPLPGGAPLIRKEPLGIWSVAISGQRLAEAGAGGELRAWDLSHPDAPRTRTVAADLERVRTVAWSPDGAVLATGDSVGAVRLFCGLDLTPCGGPAVAHAQDTWIYAVAFSPDGRHLASAGRDGKLVLWSLPSLQVAGGPWQYEGWVTSVAWTPDAKLLVSGGQDRGVHLKALEGGPDRELKGHEGWVLSVAVSPDGELIASTGEDRTVRLWSRRSGEPLAVLRDHDNLVWSVAFSPRGDELTSTGSDGRTIVWDLSRLRTPGAALLDQAERAYAVRVDGATLQRARTPR